LYIAVLCIEYMITIVLPLSAGTNLVVICHISCYLCCSVVICVVLCIVWV